MRSSISSSEAGVRPASAPFARDGGTRFPTLVLGGAAAAFLLYAGLVQVWTPRLAVLRGQSQGETNRIVAETFVDGRMAPATVIVGSSLAQRIPGSALGPDTANLALIGEGPMTGLEIVDRSGLAPKTVLIESNILERSVNQELVDDLFAFPLRQLRPVAKVLQRSKRPLNLMVDILRGGRVDTDYGVPSPEVLQDLLRDRRADLATPYEPGLIGRRLDQVAKLVADLRARGIVVAFFEMPVDPSLADLPRPVEIRTALRDRFPPDRFCWIGLDLPEPVQTRDGNHLTEPYAKMAGEQLTAKAAACGPTVD